MRERARVQGSAAARHAPPIQSFAPVEAQPTVNARPGTGVLGRTGLALRVERRRNPRLLGALAYAMPLLPALVLLLRERRNRFVRAHAVQALVYFAALALAQVALFALLVLAGGLTTSLRAAIALAAVFALAWLMVAALGFVAWTRLIAAALAGHVASLPLITPLARSLLRRLDSFATPRRGPRNNEESGIVGASGGRPTPRRMVFDRKER